MNMTASVTYQVTYAPRCDKCGSANTWSYKSKGLTLTHDGVRCNAQKQYRICRDCNRKFGVTHIKGEATRKRRK